MSRSALALLAGMLMLGLVPGPALAAGVVDQEMTSLDTNYSGPGHLAQYFTCGQAGKLTGVDLHMWSNDSLSVTAKIETIGRTTKFPSGTELTSASRIVSAAGWYHFEFAKTVDVLSGSQLAIVFDVDAHTGGFYAEGKYTRGWAMADEGGWKQIISPTTSFAFRTYVEKAAIPTAAPIATAPPPKITPAPTTKPAPATATPSSTASVTASAPSESAAASPLTASPTASGFTPATQQNSQSGDSGGPPIMIIIAGIAVVAVVLGCGIGLGLLLARRPRAIPPAS